MRQKIREQAEFLGLEITDWEVEQIIEKYFYYLVAYHGNMGAIRSIVKNYFADKN